MNLEDLIVTVTLSGTSLCIFSFVFVICVCKSRNANPSSIVSPPQHECTKCNIIIIDTSNDDIDCPICINTLIDQDLRKIYLSQCNHKFHKKCIGNYINSKPIQYLCPICRNIICIINFTSLNDTLV